MMRTQFLSATALVLVLAFTAPANASPFVVGPSDSEPPPTTTGDPPVQFQGSNVDLEKVKADLRAAATLSIPNKSQLLNELASGGVYNQEALGKAYDNIMATLNGQGNDTWTENMNPAYKAKIAKHDNKNYDPVAAGDINVAKDPVYDAATNMPVKYKNADGEEQTAIQLRVTNVSGLEPYQENEDALKRARDGLGNVAEGAGELTGDNTNSSQISYAQSQLALVLNGQPNALQEPGTESAYVPYNIPVAQAEPDDTSGQGGITITCYRDGMPTRCD